MAKPHGFGVEASQRGRSFRRAALFAVRAADGTGVPSGERSSHVAGTYSKRC